MFDGTMKPVEHVDPGDQLLGIDGTPRRVLSTTSGIGQLYEIAQRSGHAYITNADHILALEQSETSRAEGRYGELRGGLIKAADFAQKSERVKAQFFGFKRAAIFPKAVQLLDPYFIGVWLGDGDADRPAVTTADSEIVCHLAEMATLYGCRLSPFKHTKGCAKGYLIARNNGSPQENTVTAHLRALKLLRNKHVPDCYAIADEEQRLQLLAGFVDTDGARGSGYYDIVQCNEQLLRRIKWVADSLGFKTGFRPHKATLNGRSFSAWRLSIGGDIWRIPCKIERKRISAAEMSKNKDWRRTRIDATLLPGEGEYFGFELDGDRLFFLDDFTVTHNSHFFANLLIARAISQPGFRAVCLREVQRSLRESVKRLIEDKIIALGLGAHFEVQREQISTPGGGLIIFQGMQAHTAESVKSLEGYDVAWVEEAQSLSDRSLTILRPTIRKSGSELWFAWNPYRESDPVDQLLRGEHRLPDAAVREVNYRDNPWLPDELWKEMEWDRARDPDKYAHVWLGAYIRNSEARVFHNWTVAEFGTPADATFYHGADWGFSVDPTVLVRCWVEGRKLYVDQEAYKVGCEIDDTPALFDKIEGARKWVIRADSARPETISYMRRKGYPKIESARKGPGSVEEGVQFLKTHDIVVHPRCRHVIDELTHYSYKTDPKTGDVLPVLLDRKNHVIDSLRYAVEGLRRTPVTAVFSSYGRGNA